MKDDLLALSGGKCWYSEAKRGPSYFDVDHFRPKNNVKNFSHPVESCNSDEGYWWLAFDWRNYRISGEICNRGKRDDTGVCRGKKDFFPLYSGSRIAYGPSEALSCELYYLLDPTCYEDVSLIAFDEAGVPFPTAIKGSFEYDRAELTRHILYLDFPDLIEGRITTWQRCKRLINEIDNKFKHRDAASAVLQGEISNKMRNLKEMAAKEAEYSATAISCLLQSEYQWARRIAVSA